MKKFLLLFCVVSVVIIGGCGQRGDLYLPEYEPVRQVASAATAS